MSEFTLGKAPISALFVLGVAPLHRRSLALNSGSYLTTLPDILHWIEHYSTCRLEYGLLMDVSHPDLKTFRALKDLPSFDDLHFEKEVAKTICRWQIVCKSSYQKLFLCQVIHYDEKALWESYKEILLQAVNLTEGSLLGNFSLEMICVGSLYLESFNLQNLSRVMFNAGRKLQNSQSIVFPYTSAWFILKKLTPLDWGKIRFSHHIQIFPQETDKLDLSIKKMIECASKENFQSHLIFHELGKKKIFRFGSEPQTERLVIMLKKHDKVLKEKILSLQIIDQKEVVDLKLQFNVATNSASF